MDSYVDAWGKFSEMLNQRIEAYSSNSQKEAVVSTAFFWVIPAWATTCSEIHVFIKRYCEGI
jgi:hypothetical protein